MQELRCGAPLLAQNWGLKFSADDIIGLTAALQSATGKTLAGIGMFTLDGVLWTPAGNGTRRWYCEMMKLNNTYQIPCFGDSCGLQAGECQGGSGPSGGNVCNPDQGCNVCADCCKSYIHSQDDCDACVASQCKPAPVCDPAAGCNVCADCCKSYLKDPTDCASCVASSCPGIPALL
jgi:hypothetical protein